MADGGKEESESIRVARVRYAEACAYRDRWRLAHAEATARVAAATTKQGEAFERVGGAEKDVKAAMETLALLLSREP